MIRPTDQRWAPLAASLAVFASIASAVSLLPEAWDAGGDTHGWVPTNGLATVTSPGAGGHPASGGYLSIAFADSFVPQDEWIATTNAAFTGDYTLMQPQWNLYLQFDYRGDPTAAQSLYLDSSVAGGSRWEFPLNSYIQSLDWTRITVLFNGGWNWVSGQGDFALALQNVTAIGFAISHTGPLAGEYGVDDFAFQVPEPGTVPLLLATGLSLALTFSRRLAAARGAISSLRR